MKKLLLTGLGRSGTQWLVKLLREDPKVLVTHEWWKRRYGALVPMHDWAVLAGNDARHNRLTRARMRAFDAMLAATDKEVYIEVNSKARYYVPDLQRSHPDMQIVQLVRHGGDVVRSHHARSTYKPHNVNGPLEPGPADPHSLRWSSYDRFQKLCWMWAFTTSWVDKHMEDFVRFEDLLSDYNVLYSTILQPYGVNISERVWAARVGVRVDAHHHSFRLPPHGEWVGAMRRFYENTCGDILRRFGYDV